jgi:hypothetical protein
MPPPPVGMLGPQPPFGSAPITRPSASLGSAANGSAMVGQAVNMLEKALSDIPPQHPLHKEVLRAISNLTKVAPPQAQSPGVGLEAMKQMLAGAQQQSPLAALLAGRGGGGGGMPGVMPPPMGGGAPPGPGAPPGGPPGPPPGGLPIG